jgi:hypothetical protein
MSHFTVILLYPEYLCVSVPYGQEIYIAYVEADECHHAIDIAQDQAFQEGHLSTYSAQAPSDFKFVACIKDWVDISMTAADRNGNGHGNGG